MEGRIVADNGSLGNHRQVIPVHRSIRSKGQVLGLDEEIQGEHGFHQAVRNIYIYPLGFACYQEHAGVLAVHAHGLDGQKGNHHITVQGIFLGIIWIHLADDAERLAAARGLFRAGDGKGNGPPAIIGMGRVGRGLPYLYLLHDTGRGRNELVRNAAVRRRRQVRDRVASVDVVVEGNVKLLLLCLRIDERLGHPGLDSHSARSVRDIRQRRSIDIGRHIRTTGSVRRFFGGRVALGRNFIDTDDVLEVAQDRIVLGSGHQVHLIEAIHAAGRPFLIREGGVFRVVVQAVHNHIGRRDIGIRNGALVQVGGIVLVVCGRILRITLCPAGKVHKIRRGRKVRIKLYGCRQVAAVIVFVAA